MEVSVVSILKNDSVLMQMRPEDKPRPGEWEIPGGKVEASESPLLAAKREIFEELDISLELSKIIHVSTEEMCTDTGILIAHIFIYPEIEQTPYNKEGQMKLEWVKIEDMLDKTPSLESTPYVQECIFSFLNADRGNPPLREYSRVEEARTTSRMS